MASIQVFDINRNKLSDRELAEDVFNTEVKGYLLHDVVRYQRAARRQGTAATKNRGAVAGGGKKPYKQKGTGNARQGSVTAPHYVGGGAAFGPSPRNYQFKLNRKVKKAALRSALSDRYQSESLTVVDTMALGEISTRRFVEFMKRFEIGSVLVVIDEADPVVELSARNIPGAKVLRAEGLNVYDLLKYEKLVLTEGAVVKLEGVLS